MFKDHSLKHKEAKFLFKQLMLDYHPDKNSKEDKEFCLQIFNYL